jgi:GMP synthase (glutamine-hydrolysing)
MERILVVDFGGQYAHLIANRIRRIGVLADIVSPEELTNEIGSAKGIILSGGPSSVYEEHAPTIALEIFSLGVPILGICYGHQLLAHELGGLVVKGVKKEYGLANITIRSSPLFTGLGDEEQVWMSHGDRVDTLPESFKTISTGKDCPVAAMENLEKKFFGVQFHPEVTHTINGMRILENFALDICSCKKTWRPEQIFRNIQDDTRCMVGKRKVFLLVSGGVDSVVLFTLLNRAIGKEHVVGLHVDTGLMRLDESTKVVVALDKMGFDNIQVIDASEKFFSALNGIVNPEMKRKIIGEVFLDVISEVEGNILSSDNWLVAQGTIYPDIIESKGTKNADLIKTHHNRVMKMQALIADGKVIEPLSKLYKDEVRNLGKMLGLPEEIIWRHPFPGPGLAVRMLCSEGEPEDMSSVNKKLNDVRTGVFALPLNSVGVQGDSRTYRNPAVITEKLSWPELEKISTQITNSIPEVNRVILLLRQKIGELRLVEKTITKERAMLLQMADDIAISILKKEGLYDNVWQMPVVLCPISTGFGESIILRPVDSQEAMTARFSRLPSKVVDMIADKLLGLEGIDAVFYDITNKPPATIEWE